MPIDFQKTPANKNVTVWIGPTANGALGVTDVGEPLANELNNVGGSGMVNASKAISWSDFDFGTQASDTNSEPSLADSASYEEFGQSNFGGGSSFWYPLEYDDPSNLHSIVYDLVDQPGVLLDIATRIDGETEYNVPAADGDFVSVYRVEGDGETNPFTPGESKRFTKNFLQRNEFSHYTVVGDHSTLATIPATSATPAPGSFGRFRAALFGRDVTNMLQWSTDDPDVIQVFSGGIYKVTGADSDTAEITATDPHTGDTATITVTVTASGS